MCDQGRELIGWTIGRGETYDNRDYQDQVEAAALYDTLERDVVPTFYERRADGLPRRWIAHMKSCIGALCYFFNTDRMVREYTERFYLTADRKYRDLAAAEASRAKALAAWLAGMREAWGQVRIELLDSTLPDEIPVGENVRVQARVQAGALSPEDLAVELYLGRLNADGDIADAQSMPMEPVRKSGGWHIYQATVTPGTGSGLHGFTARVLPRHRDLSPAMVPGLIAWAEK
jgi:starch phosphorylase